MKKLLLIFCALLSHILSAQDVDSTKWRGKFEQLEQLLPTPNEYRTGSGAPGPKYWQQRVDYEIMATLNDANQSISGSEKILYHNNSPDALKYLWIQLDQNINQKDNNSQKLKTSAMKDSINSLDMAGTVGIFDFEGGYKILSVRDMDGNNLSYIINQTMMRIDLPKVIEAGQKFTFFIDWSFNINNRMLDNTMNDGRSGYEYFPEDGNYSYIIGQWYPRLCVYDDVVGWQNNQFLGQGEFALTFGNYEVELTVPADHIVAATGMIQNPKEVLTETQLERFEKAKSSFEKPVIIATQAEAIIREKTKLKEQKTWKFKADNVRDFAFATSRKFIWDAQAVKIGNKAPLAMSYYPKEGNPLWEQESTKAIKNALETYSKYSVEYPYPQASSVHHASIGMEYPMICFNGARPQKNGEFTDRVKWALVSVVIHEVGHNFFPMIINSDERQWTWMDEGLNTFIQYRTQVENYEGMPQRRGPASKIVPYMKGDASFKRPLMVNSETVVRRNFGNEQYGKCATALNILRETVMGPELFDKAFKEYARRWAFHSPTPADLFRTMEDASAVDLDWFWHGWFYTTDNCDQSLDKVVWYKMSPQSVTLENKGKATKSGDVSSNSDNSSPKDFNAGPKPFSVIPTDDRFYGDFQSRVNDKALMGKMENKNFYDVTLKNNGGLVMPVIIEWTYKDGTKEIDRLPAEVWRNNESTITKVFMKDKEVVKITLDPNSEIADIDDSNNEFPRMEKSDKFEELKKNSN